MATLAGTLLPATVGGDAMRIAWLWRRGVPGSGSAASIALERLTGSLVALATAVLAFAYLSARVADRTDLEPVFWLALGGLVVALAGAALSFWSGIIKPLALLPGRLGRKVAAWLTAVHASYVAYLASPGVVLAFGLLTVLEYALILIATYVVALALGIPVGLLYFLAALSLAMLVARLPVAIDGLGVFEGSLIGLLAMVGVDPAPERRPCHRLAAAVAGGLRAAGGISAPVALSRCPLPAAPAIRLMQRGDRALRPFCHSLLAIRRCCTFPLDNRRAGNNYVEKSLCLSAG